jgi:hypothetical protein
VVLVVVLCAAMTGLTYAVVALSKDSRVGDNGVMVVKGTDTPVATGGAAGGCGGLLPQHLDLDSRQAQRSQGPNVMTLPSTRRPGAGSQAPVPAVRHEP